jgi:beta-glucosidase/6-phospho-beta-glucosidase/beta-galactosidase
MQKSSDNKEFPYPANTPFFWGVATSAFQIEGHILKKRQILPFVDRKIVWRGNWFKISKDTRLYPITG